MKGLLARLLERLDENLADLDRPLTVVIPQPRPASPDEVISRHLALRGYQVVETVGSHPHCCCGGLCTDIHRQPCDRHQTDGAA